MYRQSEKNLLSSNISSTCPHNMVNFGPLAAEIVSLVWGTPGNFDGFHVLAALLHGTSSGRQPNCGVEQRAPPMFGRATITLGIGPHSSLVSILILDACLLCNFSWLVSCTWMQLPWPGMEMLWLERKAFWNFLKTFLNACTLSMDLTLSQLQVWIYRFDMAFWVLAWTANVKVAASQLSLMDQVGSWSPAGDFPWLSSVLWVLISVGFTCKNPAALTARLSFDRPRLFLTNTGKWWLSKQWACFVDVKSSCYFFSSAIKIIYTQWTRKNVAVYFWV